MLSCEFYEISKKTVFIEHLRWLLLYEFVNDFYFRMSLLMIFSMLVSVNDVCGYVVKVYVLFHLLRDLKNSHLIVFFSRETTLSDAKPLVYVSRNLF